MLLPKDLLFGDDVKALFSQVDTNQSQDRNNPEAVSTGSRICLWRVSPNVCLRKMVVCLCKEAVHMWKKFLSVWYLRGESLEQIKVGDQVKARTEKGRGTVLVSDKLLAGKVWGSKPDPGKSDVLKVTQCKKTLLVENSSLSVKGGEGKESLDEPRQPCELMALSNQQCGKARLGECEYPYTLPVSSVENCDREGNVLVSVRGNDLPMKGATPISKQLSVNSHVCWDKGKDIPSCLSVKGECFSSSFLSVKQTEEDCQPMMVNNLSVDPELILDTTKAQEGSGPEFVSAKDGDIVTRLHPVDVINSSQRPSNSATSILPVASMLLGKDMTTLSDQGDIIARAQGKHEGDLTMLLTDSVESCNEEENASNLVTKKSSSLPERGVCENPPDGAEVILDLRETQEESVVAQENVPLQQAFR
nr:uncharacterized protein LOC125638676 [Caretta caretta]XP_048710715.1 uncharacterized protein LOC125638676 [Caretta caretta]